ncbi:IS630 family transposase (plasmid) [Rhizobium sp. B230/85]|uniref:IS630 family transposase n=1 Tax=unclassified Rhizobium TaxID=2613769 RepID=UPI001ADB0809|nr:MULTISPECIES: IS630 family transposase [unclassified Rhizobium]MBO9136253.1 IS630 family transposase [Rhizobium sp. B209b/85]QXZ99932.1 IS630 family transposase [Rhizobium sp. B230/85]
MDADARKLSSSALYELRRQVVRLHKAGHKVMGIVALTGLSWQAVRKAIDAYEAAGLSSLKPKDRGRSQGDGRSLSPEQEAHIRGLIYEKRPEQLKMEFALWTRGAVMELITRECGISLKIRAVGNYLKRWGLTPQKPIRRAYEQSPQAVQAWLEATYPAIEARAKAEGGEIQWGDETAVINTDVRGRSYAPKGKTPVAYAPGSRAKLSMISTVTNQGKTRWMIIEENFGADRLIEFLEALISDADRKIFLILDNLRAHHSKLAKAWLETRKDQIEIFYLPSYSPELNPDERLNASLKHAISTAVPVKTKAKLKAAADSHMNSLANSPGIVMAFFRDPRCKYAA